jgi:fermentation-respiration switch protein FrsA (DUF1100 family)
MPTILFCNPNAVQYETLKGPSGWVNYYTERGMNIFLWNYRGYGRSQGTPSPALVKSDGEDMLQYLLQKKNCLKVGIHGYSLGGAVACHLSKSEGVEFVLTDRTFSSLSEMVRLMYGKYLYGLYSFFTFCQWKMSGAE